MYFDITHYHDLVMVITHINLCDGGGGGGGGVDFS